MQFLMGSPGADAQPLPDWDVYAFDAFGRPAHCVRGVLGMAATPEDAAEVFARTYPEFEGRCLLIVPSTVVPPRTEDERG